MKMVLSKNRYMELFQQLASNSNPVVAILASLVLIQSGVIAYQWNYTANNTVPKWIWDEFVKKVDGLMQMTTIIQDRLERK